MTRDWTPTDVAAADDDRRHREWWRGPDPFDPANDPDQIGGPDACLVAATCPDCGGEIPTGRPFEVFAAEDHDGSPWPDCQFLNGAPV